MKSQKHMIAIATLLALAVGSTLIHAGSNTRSGTLTSVRDIVGTGMAQVQLVDKRVKEDRTDFELIMMDHEGNTIGGYAPPYLADASMVPGLWRDFVSTHLSMPAEDEQITVREERRADNQPFAIAFVLDHSSSMTIPRAVRMQRAVQNSLNHFDENDYVSVVKFTSTVNVEVPPSSVKQEYMSQFKVNGLNLKSDGTAIFDASMKALAEMRDLPATAKRVLIVFTDGEDNSSTATLSLLIEEAKKQDAQVFAVTYGVTNDNPLVTLAKETKGRVHRLHHIGDFDRIFMGIYRGLRHSYVVSVDTRRKTREEELIGAITTMSASRADGVRTTEVLALVPKSGVEIAAIISDDDALVLHVDLTYLGSGEVHPADVAILDSVATLLIQRNDLSLEILGQRGDPSHTIEQSKDITRQVEAVRELLIRRGVQPHRVIGSGSDDAMRFGKNALKNDGKTTFVLTKM